MRTPTASSVPALPGWLSRDDAEAIAAVLRFQKCRGVRGDVAEFGCYLGKTAVLLGRFVQDDERLIVVDLFEQVGAGSSYEADAPASYLDLTRGRFEANYLAFHSSLPVIIQEPTSKAAERLDDGSLRFLHIDASHRYREVEVDRQHARRLLGSDGIVVFDDYRSAHAPGVAAVVWDAVVNHGLRPVLTTEVKMYATWSDPSPVQDWLLAHLPAKACDRVVWHEVAGVPFPHLPGRKRKLRGMVREALTPSVYWYVHRAVSRILGR